jgi:hypothetical protein
LKTSPSILWRLNTTRRARNASLHTIADDLLRILKTLRVRVEQFNSARVRKEVLRKWERGYSKMDESLCGLFSRTVETIEDDCERLITKKLGVHLCTVTEIRDLPSDYQETRNGAHCRSLSPVFSDLTVVASRR